MNVSQSKKDGYTAEFHMAGFTRNIEMSGTPPPDCGFPIPVIANTDSSKSLSVYFRLRQFDGKTAYYEFYDCRIMKTNEHIGEK